VRRGAKGTGKDVLAAAICNAELLGPVEFYDWDREGKPLGRQRGFPLVQVITNSEAQSKDVLRVANAMWSHEAREYHGLDCGETRTIVKGTGGRFEIPLASEASGEGDPATHIALNESQHMTQTSGGDKVARMARRNVGKSPAFIQARIIEYTNAHGPGQDSVAEKSYLAWQKQQAPGFRGVRDILYDSIEAPPNTDILTAEGRMAGLEAAYMDARDWIDLDRISAEIVDSRTPVPDTIRYYLNGLATEEDSWIQPANFDALAQPKLVKDGDRIAMFLDCSKSGDATGLVACRLEDMYVFLPFRDSVWERPHGLPKTKQWLAPRESVDAKVRAALAKWDVAWLGIDPSPALDDSTEALYWQPMIDALHRDFRNKLPLWATPGEVRGNSVLFDMRTSQAGATGRNQQFTEAAEMVAQWIDEEGLAAPLRHDGNPHRRTHTHNARRRPNQWGVSLGKVTRDSTHHVDLAVCMVGAVMGARIALNSGKLQRKRTGKAFFV
jgi:hypothetical protein